jgi:hypothetical protein
MEKQLIRKNKISIKMYNVNEQKPTRSLSISEQVIRKSICDC